MSDAEAEIVDESILEPNLPAKSKLGIIERWLEGESTPAIERIDSLVQIIEKLTAASIKVTYAEDWLVMETKDGDGNVIRELGYLQDSGAQRAGRIWGVEVSSPDVTREDFEDGTYAYHMRADAISRTSGLGIEDAIGSRWSGQPFFTRGLKDGEKVDPVKVRKAAEANLHGRIVRSLCGLNAVPVATLAKHGIEVAKVVRISYGPGSSSSGVGASNVMTFGNAKGTAIPDLSEKDLGWYIKALTENVADESKAKFKKRNETLLAALKAEQDRRKNAGAQEKETGTADISKARSTQFSRMAKLLGKSSSMTLDEALNVLGLPEFPKMTAEDVARLEAMTDDEVGAKLAEASGS